MVRTRTIMSRPEKSVPRKVLKFLFSECRVHTGSYSNVVPTDRHEQLPVEEGDEASFAAQAITDVVGFVAR